MKAKLIVLITLLFFTSIKTFAGWYDIYNYTGFIDRHAVTLSFQLKEGYFGEPAKKNYNIIGVYKYDRFNNPIRLEGVFNKNTQKIKFYEIGKGDQISATFSLHFSLQQLTGSWSGGKNRLKVNLNLTNRLSDLAAESFNNIQILQSPSLKDYYFEGVYAKKTEGRDASMTALKIIKKADNKIFQILDFEAVETPTGNLMTIIYDNITTGKGNDFIVSNQIGRVGGYLNVRFNPKIKRFVLNPEPIAEGVNGSE
jgi:hypothetical protein